MVILPVKLQEAKEKLTVTSDDVSLVTPAQPDGSYEIPQIFIDLYVLHLITGDIYISACDTDIPWYIPRTSTVVTYVAQPIERGDFKQTSDNKVDNVDIKIDNTTDDFTSAMMQSFDFRGTNVDIVSIAYPASLSDSDAYKFVFNGYLDAPILDMSNATFQATLKSRTPAIEGGRTCMLSCGAWFGSAEECGATLDTRNGTVTSSSTQSIIYCPSDGTPDNYWKSGVLSIGFESKKVIASTSTSKTVEFPFYSVPPIGTAFSVSSGCDKSKTDCIRHGNLQNYGGYPSIPFEYQIKT